VYDYAKTVQRRLRAAGFHVDADLADKKMQKKVREAQVRRRLGLLQSGTA
jgi:threonyl-tRNA synthetase